MPGGRAALVVTGLALASGAAAAASGPALSGRPALAAPVGAPRVGASEVGGAQVGRPVGPAARAPGLLAGQVVEHPSGRGVAGAVVMLRQGGRAGPPGTSRGAVNPWNVAADSQGRFYFANLMPGAYTVGVAANGYTDIAPGVALRTYDIGAGERVTDLRVRVTPLARLSGTIVDDAGAPVVGTTVVAFRRSLANGVRALIQAGNARSDDRGAYRLSALAPGEYLLCACGRDPIPFDGVLLTTLAAEPYNLLALAARAVRHGADAAELDRTLRTYPPTFHPDSRTASQSTALSLRPGEERTSVDVRVTPTASTRVSGVVTGGVGPVRANGLRLVPATEGDEGALITALVPALVQSDGRFDFAGVPPGAYVLRAVHAPSEGDAGPSGAALAFIGARSTQAGTVAGRPLANEPPLWAAEAVSVTDDGARGLTLALRRSASVSGRVEYVGASPPPAAEMLARAAVLPRPIDPERAAPALGNAGRISADGTFRMPGVTPGRYVLTVTPIPGWPTLKSIAAGGVDVTDLPFEMTDRDVSDVVVTVSNVPMARLEGSVARGAATESLTALVFPTDKRYWSAPAAAQRRLRSSPVGRSGKFILTGMPEGEYFVALVLDQDANEWQSADLLERLARGARRVVLRDGDTVTVEVGR